VLTIHRRKLARPNVAPETVGLRELVRQLNNSENICPLIAIEQADRTLVEPAGTSNRSLHACVLRFRCHLTGPVQESTPGWILLSCRALSSPTTCRFIPAHSDLPPIRPVETLATESSPLRALGVHRVPIRRAPPQRLLQSQSHYRGHGCGPSHRRHGSQQHHAGHSQGGGRVDRGIRVADSVQ
jgi:hypothetical protein